MKDRLRLLAQLNLVGLVLLYLLGEFVGEKNGITTLIAYCPAPFLVLPTLPLLLAAIRYHHRTATHLGLIALAFGMTVLMDLHIPTPRLPDHSGKHVRVMTYNIHLGLGGIDKITETIRAAHADVVCLQEVGGINVPDLYPELTVALPEYRIAWGVDSAILTRLPIQAVLDHPLVGNLAFRGATEVVLNVEGTPVSVFSTHLATAVRPEQFKESYRTFRDSLQFTTDIRSRQIDTLMRATTSRHHPLIICGDFNTPPRGPLYQRLTNRWDDAFAACGIGYGYTYPESWPLLRIDHIFTGNGARADSIVVQHPEIAGVSPSDHLPIVAEIQIPGPDNNR